MTMPLVPMPPFEVRIEGMEAMSAWAKGWRSGYAAALRTMEQGSANKSNGSSG